jgi:YesN/AraC family two-component response regulator
MKASPNSLPHILIVDDESAIRDGLSIALKDSYIVHTAAMGNEARVLLREHPIAAIVLDAILKGEHGLDLVADFRKLLPAPVLMLTGHSTEELAIRALRAEVRDYLKKPVNLQALHLKLARLVRQSGCPSDPVARACRLLEDRPEQPHTTATLAKDVGLCERHLRRRFREAFGKTPRRYLTEVRMNLAAERLLCTDTGIEEVGYGVGYPNPTTFGRLFKRAFGLTPSEYRARFR